MILITGGAGQLSYDLVRALTGRDVVALGRADLDITVPEQIEAPLERLRPKVVINTAAFHRVDLCEDEPELAFEVNAAAPRRLAAACAGGGALLVHISTDYVFGGRQDTPYTEEDPVDPINVYGVSKAAGEMAIRCTTDNHLIVRTTGLYGIRGMLSARGNFVETMIRLAEQGRPITVVGDQVLTPSSAGDVAAAIVALIDRGATGTYHVTNGGSCSWYDFAAEIFRLAGMSVELARTFQAEWPARAPRPAYSVLDHAGLRRAGIAEPRLWKDALAAYIQERTAKA